MTFRLADAEPSPDSFAAVMATGILSIAAAKHQYGRFSDTLGVLATVGLLVLVVLVLLTKAIASWDLKEPDVTLRLFTFVAACAVLDSRLASYRAVLQMLGVVALLSSLVLIVPSVRDMSAHPWRELRDRSHGAWELASVGTSGLAIVATLVARHTPERWWLGLAVPVWAVALCIYALMTWLIVWRAVAQRHERGGAAGFEPDSWILMGGLAIATLAGDDIHILAPAGLGPTVRMVTVVTWVAATLWIPPLVYFGLQRLSRRPAMLRFAGVWWALVFPLGMYSAATDVMGAELGRRSLSTVSLVFFWDALAAWLIVAVAGVLRAVGTRESSD
ncbi:tellurite resistance/C4-dicarboxylate transporter family protein [Mycobacterium ostraviense]|uniref:C4-dicarboxylate ABC transporter n=1 Tax=Mycobacterium ostraviense TaxID=2738409 RepID=A0A164BJV1_9MYCO|nr:tellurite resistance/C4-dicarboxylate transporter family protein [Mycobacterium ostraviense]KZS63565.1 C4-dicarboxylate ABC transporter [Mycobacterium ostraviense]UGT92004.1 tellurite resistance/C4-dicarboxylate transporter family protein [Mycobacterium ostraviense]